MSQEEIQQHNFQTLGIEPVLLKRLQSLGFVHPTPIQFKAIPIATSGEDVVGIAQTGSGKTLAFSIPMLQHIHKTKNIGLVLVPTRELAVQVEETIKKIGGVGFKTALIIGGTSASPQIRQIRAKPHVLVATPGRLIDHIEQKRLSLSNVGILVLDEADRMLDMGFAPQLKRILSYVPTERQTMLFSATMPEKIAEIAQKYMKKPLRIEVAKPGTIADKIDQEVFIVPREEKIDLLKRLLSEHKGSVLVFSRTKHGAKKIAHKIRQMGHTADEIHSNRSQNQRQKALKGFATGSYRIMVATDIAARGIDVDNIELVLNFDLPEQIEDYTHRIGRTGRAGRSGKAISFASPEQKGDIAQIQKLINMTLPIKSPSGKKLEFIRKPMSGNPSRNKPRPGQIKRNQSQKRFTYRKR
ncbi:DEAD/DEAH box helicase [Candidatus Peregrinibacteria bacterium]|nr:DEAD/DEAH box helicase [Candidatus Peregrinibacteria bacterium]